MNQSVSNRDGAVEFLAEIVGRVVFAVKLKSGGNVVDSRDRRNNWLQILDRVIECSCIDEGLEYGAGLAMAKA